MPLNQPGADTKDGSPQAGKGEFDFPKNFNPVGSLIGIGITTTIIATLGYFAVAKTLTYWDSIEKQQKIQMDAERIRADTERARTEAEKTQAEEQIKNNKKLEAALDHQMFAKEATMPFSIGNNNEGYPQFFVIQASMEFQGTVSRWIAFLDTRETANAANGAPITVYCRKSYDEVAVQLLTGVFKEHSSWQGFPRTPRAVICGNTPAELMLKLRPS